MRPESPCREMLASVEMIDTAMIGTETNLKTRMKSVEMKSAVACSASPPQTPLAAPRAMAMR